MLKNVYPHVSLILIEFGLKHFPIDRRKYRRSNGHHKISTGTHVGTDFMVSIGTPIFAPVDGEMFKAEFNQYKGNVGIYIFEHKGVTWGLELCHLRELPPLGKHK